MEELKKRLNHRLERLTSQRDELEDEHVGEESKFTYWGGHKLGYVKGKINEVEDFIGNINDHFSEESCGKELHKMRVEINGDIFCPLCGEKLQNGKR